MLICMLIQAKETELNKCIRHPHADKEDKVMESNLKDPHLAFMSGKGVHVSEAKTN